MATAMEMAEINPPPLFFNFYLYLENTADFHLFLIDSICVRLERIELYHEMFNLWFQFVLINFPYRC